MDTNEKEKIIYQAAEIIKDLSEKGYTKYRIAKETSIAEKTIGNYVNGVNKPSFANAKILIRYFKAQTIKNRFNTAVNYLKEKEIINSHKDLSEKMNSSYPSVVEALSGDDRYLNYGFLARFNETFNNIFNIDWLLAGEGEMLNNNYPSNQNLENNIMEPQGGYNLSNTLEPIDTPSFQKLTENIAELVKNNTKLVDIQAQLVENNSKLVDSNQRLVEKILELSK